MNELKSGFVNKTILIGDFINKKRASHLPVVSNVGLLEQLKENFTVEVVGEHNTTKNCCVCQNSKIFSSSFFYILINLITNFLK